MTFEIKIIVHLLSLIFTVSSKPHVFQNEGFLGFFPMKKDYDYYDKAFPK